MQAAAGDYGKCAEYLDELHLGGSEQTLGACRRNLRAVTTEIDSLRPKSSFDLRIEFPFGEQ